MIRKSTDVTNHSNAANEPVFNARGLMDADIPPESVIQQTMLPQAGQDFNAWMGSRVARYATRSYDWDALKFQADFDPKYRRAQMRYVGTGATGVAAITTPCQWGTLRFPRW